MEKQIKEVQDYFINKLINQDYTIVEATEYKATVNVEGYFFKLWIGNGMNNFETYNGSFIQLSFNEYQKEKIYNDLIKKSKNQKLEYLLKQKEKINNQIKEL